MNENDYKYVLQDLSRTMLGARYTYGELMSAERVPFKFQTIIDRLILPIEAGELSLAEHMLKIGTDDKNYRVYDALKTRIRFYEPKSAGGFVQKQLPLKDFVAARAAFTDQHFIQEISISNLALSGFKL